MTTPRWQPGVRLHHDAVRGQWIVQAPERVIELDEIAHAILQRVDGKRDIEAIVTSLAAEFEADPAEVRGDVLALLDDLASKRIVSL